MDTGEHGSGAGNEFSQGRWQNEHGAVERSVAAGRLGTNVSLAFPLRPD